MNNNDVIAEDVQIKSDLTLLCVQLTEHNIYDIGRMLQCSVHFDPGAFEPYLIITQPYESRAFVGDYIVQDNQGGYHTIKDTLFKCIFEVVDYE